MNYKSRSISILYLILVLSLWPVNAEAADHNATQALAVGDLLRLLQDNRSAVRDLATDSITALLLLHRGKAVDLEVLDSSLHELTTCDALKCNVPNCSFDIQHAVKELEKQSTLDAVVTTLIAALEKPESDLEIRDLARALAATKDKRAVPIFRRALTYWVPIRAIIWANFALHMLGERDAVPFLIELLGYNQDRQDGRSNAAQALGEIGDTRAVEPLIHWLPQSDTASRRYVIDALGIIGDRRAVDPLIKALEEPNAGIFTAEIQAKTARALGMLRDPRAIDSLTKLREHGVPYARKAAAQALEIIFAGEKRDAKPKGF